MRRHCFRLVAILVLIDPVARVFGEPNFVAIAPCRILDSSAGPDAGQRVRAVDLISTRCGRMIPPYATKYSVRITRIPHTLPASAVPASSREVTTMKIPAQSGRPLNFDVPGDAHIAVDVDGYYVAPGAPVSPVAATAVTESATESAAAPPSPFRQAPVPHSAHGSAGHLWLDASQPSLSNIGVLMTAEPASPWIAAKTGTNTAGSGFAVINASNTELMRVRGDGAVQLAAGAFFDGRIDYFGSPGSFNGYVSVPGNVINDVTLVNPYDASGGSTNRVVFFRARTDDEYGSPPTTKFEAFTLGFYGHEDVNFDSKIRYHRQTGQYHYRAMGAEYQNNAFVEKPTFWVKADTNLDSITQTRADMYVSGRVGIGTTTPGTILHLMKAAPAALGPEMKLENSGNAVGDASAVTFASNLVNRAQIRSTVEVSPWRGTLEFHTGFGTLTERMRITGAGTVGIGTASPNPAYILDVHGNVNVSGNIGAKYQDVAEWVPSTQELVAGIVVVLDPARSNHVLASSRAYDTSVAGVVSAQPGLILGEAGPSKAMVATTGRVRVRVDATKQPIAIGDLLVTSDKPGIAMKSMPLDFQGVALHRPGTVVGKALEPLSSGEGEILVLLSLQ